MAAAAAAATVPSPPLPSPASRRAAAAALAQSRRDLVATAVAVVMFLILAMVMLLCLRRIGRDVCGERCPLFAATDELLIGSMGTLVVLALVAAVCTIFLAFCMKPEKAPDPNDLAAADRPVLRVLILGMLAFLGFIVLTLGGILLQASSPVEGYITEGIGSIVVDAAVVSHVLLNCLILLPAMALFAWKRMLVIWQSL